MSTRIRKWLLGIGLGFIITLGFAAPAIADSTSPKDTTTVQVAPTEVPTAAPSDTLGSTVAEFGPWGGLITIAGTAAVWIIREVNNGKNIDVQKYKDRAVEAENNANIEIGKVHTKLSILESKLDTVLADWERDREEFSVRKQAFTSQVLEMEQRHQRELEEVHDKLIIEVRARHNAEKLLAAHNIEIPDLASETL
jgi:hypothetical protein